MHVLQVFIMQSQFARIFIEIVCRFQFYRQKCLYFDIALTQKLRVSSLIWPWCKTIKETFKTVYQYVCRIGQVIQAPKLPNRFRTSLHHTADERWLASHFSTRNASTLNLLRCHTLRTRQRVMPKIRVDNVLWVFFRVRKEFSCRRKRQRNSEKGLKCFS